MSTLRATNIRGRQNGNAPVLPDGAVITGVITATTFSGNITGNVTGDATGLTGTPDITVGTVNATTVSVAGIVTTNVSGIHAGTGIITATSFSGSASGLTAVPSAQLSGALPALDGSALTNLNIPEGFSELDAALFN